jgi:TP901 family phage tail tape measure protein
MQDRIGMSIGTGGNLGSARGQIIIDTEQSRRNIRGLQGDLDQFGNRSANSLARSTTAGYGLIAMGSALVGVLGFGVKTAFDFEAAMSGVSAALGGTGTAAGITTEQFKALEDEALRIGSTTSKSAGEAAQAMELMAKAGVDVERILNGGAQAAVNISEATGEGLQQSADTMSAMLNLFKDTGIEADRAADIIVTGMNASSATMNEFQTGIARLAPVITATGMSFEDASASIAFFNAKGFSAAEVGTSLTRAYTSLVAPTDKAATAIATLGVQAFDAAGNFIGFPALMDQLADAEKRVGNDAEFARLLVEAFGVDAVDILGAGAKEGGAGLRVLSDEMEVSGSAAAAAAERMDNLKGKLEELRGVVEVIAQKMGKVVLPALTAFVGAFTGGLEMLLGLGDGVVAILGIVAGILGAISIGVGAFVVFGPQIQRMAQSFGALGTAMRALLFANPILLALAVTIGALTAAYATNFGGFKDFVDGIVSKVAEFVGAFRTAFKQAEFTFTKIGSLGSGFIALGSVIKQFFGLDATTLFMNMAKIADRIGKNIGRMTGQFQRLSRIFKDKGFTAGISALFGDVGRNLLAEFGDIVGALPRLVGQAMRGITTGFEPLDNVLHGLGRAFQQFGKLIENVFAGDFGKAATNVGNIIERIRNAIPNLIEIGRVGLDMFFELAGEALEAARDFGEWLKPHLIAGGRKAVDVGVIALEATIALAGEIGRAAANFVNWLWDKLVGTGAVRITDKEVEVSGTVRIVNMQVLGGKDDPGFLESIQRALSVGVFVSKVLYDVMGPFAIARMLFGLLRQSAIAIGSYLRIAFNLGFDTLAGISPETWATILRGLLMTTFALAIAPAVLLAGLVGLMGTLIVSLVQGFIFQNNPVTWQGFVDSLRSTISGALKLGLNVAQAIASIATDIANFVAGLVSGLTDAIQDADFDFSAAGAAIGQALIDAVGGFIRDNWNPLDWFGGGDLPDQDEAVKDVMESSRHGKGGGGGELTADLFMPRDAITALAEGETAIANAGAAATTFTTTAGTLGIALATLAQSATTAAQGFATGIQGGISRAVGFATVGATMIRSALTLPNMGAQGFAVGMSLGQGIANGISSAVGVVRAAAAGIVNAAVQAAQSAGQISSPSKLTAVAVGSPLGEGVAVGILSQSGAVQQAMNAIMPNSLGRSAFAGRGGGGQTIVNNYTSIGLRTEELETVLAGTDAAFESNNWIQQATSSYNERVNRTRRWAT